MSGFKDDVLAILRDNVLLHGEAMGLIVAGWKGKYKELLDDLHSRKFPVTDRNEKQVFRFDYIVLPWYSGIHGLLKALAVLNKLGIVILEIDKDNDQYYNKYSSIFADITVTKVSYGDRKYLVIHSGVDYGN